jgi:hypothetical protein
MKRSLGRGRAILGWFAGSLLAVQLALAAAVECCWPDVRDPEWSVLVGRLRQRQQETPGRELVVVLGSSRGETGLQAARLSDRDGSLVFNLATPGGGVLMEQLTLQRLLDEGVRPDRVVLEVMPLFCTDAGAVMEEGYVEARSLTAAEVRSLAAQAARPDRLAWAWLCSRLMPLSEHHAALQRRLLPPRLRPLADAPACDRDSYGWKPYPVLDELRQSACVAMQMQQYRGALHATDLSAQRQASLWQLLARCRQEGIEVVLYVGPEHSRLRAATPPEQSRQLTALLESARREYGVGTCDARDWLPDAAFHDAHHPHEGGAEALSDRFAADALRPLTPRR